MKHWETKNGYLQVALCQKTKQTFYIHRLVAETFIPNPHGLKEVNHINENKHDNRVENLEWISKKNNINYGTGKQRSAEQRGKQVRCVETGIIYESIKQASEKTGITQTTICNCCKGKQKTTGGLHWEYV